MLADTRAHCDVLIVGPGSAGSVLAEQLSADPTCQAMVVEAGPGLDEATVRELIGNALVLPIGPGSPQVPYGADR